MDRFASNAHLGTSGSHTVLRVSRRLDIHALGITAIEIICHLEYKKSFMMSIPEPSTYQGTVALALRSAGAPQGEIGASLR